MTISVELFNNIEPWQDVCFFFVSVKLLPCHFSSICSAPSLERCEILLGPEVTYGPPGLSLTSPVAMTIAHCAEVVGENWSVRLKKKTKDDEWEVRGVFPSFLFRPRLHLKFRLASGALWFIIPPLASCKVRVIFKKHSKKKCVYSSSSQSACFLSKRWSEMEIVPLLCNVERECVTEASGGQTLDSLLKSKISVAKLAALRVLISLGTDSREPDCKCLYSVLVAHLYLRELEVNVKHATS